MTTTPSRPQQDPQAFLLDLYRVAVQRAQPLHSMGQHLPPPPKGRTVVLGAGKGLEYIDKMDQKGEGMLNPLLAEY